MFLPHLKMKNQMTPCGNNLTLNTKNIYFVGYLSKNKITNNLKNE